MLRRLGIRWKILAILAVPIAVLTAGALLISLTAVADSRSTRQVANLINAAEDMRSVVESLQFERYASIRLIQAPPNSAATKSIENEVEQSRWLTDQALEKLRTHVEIIDFDLIDERIYDLVENTVEIHARLGGLRSRVDADSITDGAALTSYNEIIRNDIMLSSRLGGLIEQRDSAQFLSAYSTLDLLVEYLEQERNIGERVITSRERTDRTEQELRTLAALQDSLLYDSESELDALDTDARIPAIATNLYSMRLLVQTGSPDALSRMDVDAWLESVDRVIENVNPARVEVIEVASKRADQAATDARNQAIFTSGGAAIAVIFSLALALIVARGIVVPLRRLTTAAEKVRDDLPRLVEQVATPGVAPDTELEEIPVESEDEIGKLASAFNSVNETTIVVAREQAALRGSIAEMFVNVARRDQVLLNRQLSFITQLERTEEDPTQLEDLFRLDHLATRMRRNAESLLVLAGIDSGRRLRNPMAVSDVVRTASSEIEHYDRVDLVLTADPAILGHAALTVAHLLAELMENATVFSDPTSRVEVMTAMREDGVAISITDDGLGMDPAVVAEVNEKIRSSSASDVIGAQRLGMFVVGRLANRHDIQVHISSHGEGHGTRVDVLVPLTLLDPQSLAQHHAMAQQHQLQSAEPQTIQSPHADLQPTQPAQPAAVQPAGGYEPQIADSGAGALPGRGEPEQGLPVRGSDVDQGLPVRGAAAEGGLPVRGGAGEGLPTRAPAAQAPIVPPTTAPAAAGPAEPTERAGLFTGFRSVAANPLESLESVDADAFASGQGAAYVPLVTEDHDADILGVSRDTTHTSEQPAVDDEAAEDVEQPYGVGGQPAEQQSAVEPEIAFDSQPFPDRGAAQPAAAAAGPAISYDNSPAEPAQVDPEPQFADQHGQSEQHAQPEQVEHGEQIPHGDQAPAAQQAYEPEQYAAAETAEVDDKPQTQIRVYTGAFPTATGEYPTYTGEIPLHTGQTGTYPSRRSRRDMRPEDAQPVVSVDHHVEFEPIGLEDDEAPAVEQAHDASVIQPESDVVEVAADPVVDQSQQFAQQSEQVQQQNQQALQAQQTQQNQQAQQPQQSQFPAAGDSAYRPTTGGFPTAATPGVGVVQPQPSGSFDASVLGVEEPEEREKPKRKLFALFGRKHEPEVEEPQVRESRFPGGTSFTPQEPAQTAQQAQPIQPEPIQPAQPIQPVQPIQSQPDPVQQPPASPAAGLQLPQRQTAFQPQAQPEIPQPEPTPEPIQPQQPVAAPSSLPTRGQVNATPSVSTPQPSTPKTPERSATPSWAPAQSGPASAPMPSVPAAKPAFTPQTSWAPMSESGHGALGAEAAEQLRRSSAMKSEVLSELSQLSTYQPEAHQKEPAGSLTKRVPSEVPKQVEEEAPAQPARRRDASQVRSMLSGFQAGVSRAASAGAADSVQDGEER